MEKKKLVAIIQAHMSSTRLPGKILKDLCGMPALYRMIERVRQSKSIDRVVVATSTLPCDDELVALCREWGVDTFRGSDSDVLERFWGAAKAYPAKYYMRLTSDCPLIDPGQIDEMVVFFKEKSYRYLRGDAKRMINGMDCEIFTAELLRETYENATEGYEHEHVTPYMYTKQDSVGLFPVKENGAKYRLTLDTPEDYEVLKAVYEALYTPGNTFTKGDMMRFLDDHPEILAINSEVHQKGFKEGYEEQ